MGRRGGQQTRRGDQAEGAQDDATRSAAGGAEGCHLTCLQFRIARSMVGTMRLVNGKYSQDDTQRPIDYFW
jgi:hypothetical protein